jgi:hypothetical protein
MRDVIYLLFHLLTTLLRLAKPGGGRTVIAENLMLKQQLIIHSKWADWAQSRRIILLVWPRHPYFQDLSAGRPSAVFLSPS